MKCDFIRYSSAETTTKNTVYNQLYINIAGEDSVTSLINTYLEINPEIIKKTDNSRYANGDDIWFVNLVPIALFSNYILTTTSAINLEDIAHA